MWSKIMNTVKEELPPFNNYLLKDYRKEQISKATEYVDVVFKQAIKLFAGEIEYLGYTILAPEHRIDEANDPSFKRGFNIQMNELQLVRFEFKYKDEIIFVPIYIPYIKNGAITIGDTKYYLQLAIIEKVIYRVSDGVIVKVIRSPLFFWRTEQFSYESTKGKVHVNAIITTRVHNKKIKPTKKDIKTALLLYILIKFGYLGTLQKFNIDPEDVKFVDKEEVEIDDTIEYIKIRNDLYARVKGHIFDDITKSRVVASLIYCLKAYKNATITDIYDTNCVIWKIILGKCTYGWSQTKDTLAHNHTEKHMFSLASYMDPITKNELAKQGIYCDDIYDLFLVVFCNINTWIVDYKPNNLFHKKIAALELVMSEIVKAIFTKFYVKNSDQQLNIKTVKSILKIPPMKIAGIYSSGAVRSSAAIYNDNSLLTIEDKKIRQPIDQNKPGANKVNKKKANDLTKSPEHQFDPSFVAVESILDIPSSNPGDGGAINPYAQIDEDGGLICPDYAAKDLGDLSKYLPSR